ncbi:hypothetical protein AAAC51_44270 [Priestia megaterium]
MASLKGSYIDIWVLINELASVKVFNREKNIKPMYLICSEMQSVEINFTFTYNKSFDVNFSVLEILAFLQQMLSIKKDTLVCRVVHSLQNQLP